MIPAISTIRDAVTTYFISTVTGWQTHRSTKVHGFTCNVNRSYVTQWNARETLGRVLQAHQYESVVFRRRTGLAREL